MFWASVEHEFGQLPRDGLILPPLGGCRPQATARCPGPESSGDSQPWNRAIVRPPGPRRLKRLDIGSSPTSPCRWTKPRSAHAVWACENQLSTIPRTRWRLRRLHNPQADYLCRKRQSRAGTVAINDSRPTGSPSRMTMTASSLHRVVPDQRRTGVRPATPRRPDSTATWGTRATGACSLPRP